MKHKPAPAPNMRNIWYLLPVCSGCLISLAFPPYNATPVAWFGLVPLLLFLRRANTVRRAFLGAWLAGVAYFLLVAWPFTSLIWWGWAQTPAEAEISIRQQRMFLGAWYPLTSVWCGAWWGVWGAALVGLARSARARVWLAAALWILICEHWRSLAFFDFTWGFLGYALYPYHRLCRLASMTGLAGLSALVVLVNALIAHLACSLWHVMRRSAFASAVLLAPGQQRRELLLIAGILATAASAWWVAGLDECAEPDRAAPARIRVAALQAQRRKYTREEMTSGSLDWAYTGLIDEALARKAQYIVLPESVWLATLALDDVPVPDTLSQNVSPAAVHEFLAPRLAASHAVVVADFNIAQQGRMYTSIVSWDAAGLRSRYDKRRLTPFAEYPPGPFRYFAPKNRITFTPGHGSQLLEAGGVKLGGFICQEVQFPALIRKSVRAGAQMLVSTGNDGIFSHPAVMQGHAIAAVFRALETHRPIVRAMKTGVSAIIDAHGREVSASVMNQEALLCADITPSNRVTFYVRWGDWPIGLAALTLLVACLCKLMPRVRVRCKQAAG